uniref:Uncharacterized protein n=1 Tax=Manihot esculenta TaxID=3983 RepID=A0A2C9WP22_MANES
MKNLCGEVHFKNLIKCLHLICEINPAPYYRTSTH